jgi:serine/threonine-protein kinase
MASGSSADPATQPLRPVRAETEAAPGALIHGKYRLEKLLARGGMGTVWAARDEQLRRPVAVKLMGSQFLSVPMARSRFEREAVAAARLHTPHVVQVHDHGVEGDVPFIVMEMLDGEDLGQHLKRVKRTSIAEAADLVGQLAKALRKAHDAGIVHRDLKPPNVFLARTDDGIVAKILDFGVAKADIEGMDGESTTTGMLVGSPHYMSPEQARGLRAIDARSDLWSLGVIVYRLLTGQVPFRGEATGDVIVRICAEPIPRATSIDPALPADVDAFFEKALCRDPAGRFQSVTELAAALRDLAVRAGDGAPSVLRGSAPSLPTFGSGESRFTPSTRVETPAPGSVPSVSAAPTSMPTPGSLPLSQPQIAYAPEAPAPVAPRSEPPSGSPAAGTPSWSAPGVATTLAAPVPLVEPGDAVDHEDTGPEPAAAPARARVALVAAAILVVGAAVALVASKRGSERAPADASPAAAPTASAAEPKPVVAAPPAATAAVVASAEVAPSAPVSPSAAPSASARPATSAAAKPRAPVAAPAPARPKGPDWGY